MVRAMVDDLCALSEEHGERVSIKRARELRTKILNETRGYAPFIQQHQYR